MAKKANSDSIGWGVMRQGRGLWSRNAVKGEQVRDERLRRDGKIEWRSWNPRSSKLGAAIIRTSGDAEILLLNQVPTFFTLGQDMELQFLIFMIMYVAREIIMLVQ